MLAETLYAMAFRPCFPNLITLSWLQVVQFKRFWFDTMKRESKQSGACVPAGTLRVPDVARDIAKKTEGHARSFNAVVMLNKKVHVERYNAVMRTCVAEILGE